MWRHFSFSKPNLNLLQGVGAIHQAASTNRHLIVDWLLKNVSKNTHPERIFKIPIFIYVIKIFQGANANAKDTFGKLKHSWILTRCSLNAFQDKLHCIGLFSLGVSSRQLFSYRIMPAWTCATWTTFVLCTTASPTKRNPIGVYKWTSEMPTHLSNFLVFQSAPDRDICLWLKQSLQPGTGHRPEHTDPKVHRVLQEKQYIHKICRS